MKTNIIYFIVFNLIFSNFGFANNKSATTEFIPKQSEIDSLCQGIAPSEDFLRNPDFINVIKNIADKCDQTTLNEARKKAKEMKDVAIILRGDFEYILDSHAKIEDPEVRAVLEKTIGKNNLDKFEVPISTLKVFEGMLVILLGTAGFAGMLFQNVMTPKMQNILYFSLAILIIGGATSSMIRDNTVEKLATDPNLDKKVKARIEELISKTDETKIILTEDNIRYFYDTASYGLSQARLRLTILDTIELHRSRSVNTY